MKILIVKLSSFGDIVHALPVVKSLKSFLPNSEVHWVADEDFIPLLRHLEGVDRLIGLPIRRWKSSPFTKSVPEMIGKIRELRRDFYDYVIDVQGNIKSGIVTLLARGEVKCGFSRNGVREAPNLLFTNVKVPLKLEDKHITRKYLRVALCGLGFDLVEPDYYPSLVPDSGIRSKMSVFFDGDGVKIAVHPGTTWETKGLSENKWKEVLDTILADLSYNGMNGRLYLTWGTGEEREMNSRLVEGVKVMDSGVSVHVARGMGLEEFIAFLSHMDVVVGPDTGPVHLAAALGVKTVSFYRATLAERNAPVGRNHRAIQASVDCKGCLRRHCSEMDRCEREIDAREISKHVIELLRQT